MGRVHEDASGLSPIGVVADGFKGFWKIHATKIKTKGEMMEKKKQMPLEAVESIKHAMGYVGTDKRCERCYHFAASDEMSGKPAPRPDRCEANLLWFETDKSAFCLNWAPQRDVVCESEGCNSKGVGIDYG